jgi:peptide/nickel transport system substrate-binding protein
MIDSLSMGSFGGGSNPQVNYNPFSPNTLVGGYIYEPLMALNTFACEYEPWLATAFEWKDAQNLQFTIREGVKWSDGQPFTPDDVVFTMDMLKEHTALDARGMWQVLETVTAEGNNVLFKFKEPAVSYFERTATHIVVPKHIWEKEADPVTFVNENPVATGPFLPEAFNQRQLTLKRNESYWQADKVRVNKLVFTKAEGGNQVENLKLARGEYDMNAMFIPNIEQAYVSQDPKNNHYWFPAGGAIGLGMNLTKAPFNDLEFRRAMAYAINRDEIITKAQFGYVKKASQTGLVLPNQTAWLPSDIADEGYFPFDQAKATQILEAAGYKKGSDGKFMNKDGQPMELTFLVQSGWTDWMQAAQIIQSNLNAMGITLDVQTPTPEIVDAQRAAGEYDMLFVVHGGACSMYDNYYYHLDSESPPTSNYIFHKNPEVDELINQLRSAVEEDKQKELVGKLAKYSFEQFPTVPLWYGANWFQYSTRKADGWPNADNPYAKPGDWPLIITSLKPSGSS